MPATSCLWRHALTGLWLGMGVLLGTIGQGQEALPAGPADTPAVAPAAEALPVLRQAPFKTGEKLAYRLTWGPFTVGMLSLEVVGPAVIEAQNALHFVMEVRTNDFADSIYRVRGRGDTWVTPELSRSLAFQHHQEEGKLKRDYTMQFNWETRRTKYTSATKNRKPLRLEKDTFDPFGVFFYLRTYAMEPGGMGEIMVTDGKRVNAGKLTIVGREKVTIGDKIWDAILVEPDMQGVGGVFEKSKNAKLQVWFSDDARRLPLKVSSSVAVGSFVAELVSDTPGTDAILLAPRTTLPPMPPDPPKVVKAAPATAVPVQ